MSGHPLGRCKSEPWHAKRPALGVAKGGSRQHCTYCVGRHNTSELESATLRICMWEVTIESTGTRECSVLNLFVTNTTAGCNTLLVLLVFSTMCEFTFFFHASLISSPSLSSVAAGTGRCWWAAGPLGGRSPSHHRCDGGRSGVCNRRAGWYSA